MSIRTKKSDLLQFCFCGLELPSAYTITDVFPSTSQAISSMNSLELNQL